MITPLHSNVMTVVSIVFACMAWGAVALFALRPRPHAPLIMRWGGLVMPAALGVYWLAVSIARVVFGYVGPSVPFTIAGAIISGSIIVYFLGIALLAVLDE